MIDLTDIIRAAITLILALITSFLIPYLKRRIDADKLEQLRFWVKIAVNAAEQIFSQPGMGEEKREYVISFFEERGYTVDIDTLQNLIEAAVLELNREK